MKNFKFIIKFSDHWSATEFIRKFRSRAEAEIFKRGLGVECIIMEV